MADHQRIDAVDIERERIGVACLQFPAALRHAAVQQDPPARRFDQVQGAGDLAGRAVEMHTHAPTPSVIRV